MNIQGVRRKPIFVIFSLLNKTISINYNFYNSTSNFLPFKINQKKGKKLSSINLGLGNRLMDIK